MPKVDAIAEIAADGVADGMHIVGEEALAAEKLVRAFDGVRLAYLGLGVAIGGVIGSLVTMKAAYRKAEAKFSAIADDEIAGMREHYNSKIVAAEANVAKGDLAKIIADQRYSDAEPEQTEPPMAITPPASVVDAAREAAEEETVTAALSEVQQEEAERETRIKDPEVRNVFKEAEVEDTWDYHEERRKRTPLQPYVIHVDERDELAAYDSVTLTYYEEDDVLCRENDEVVGKEERDTVIGEENLGKFGHGSNDASIVYVRNDKLEVDFEIVRSPNSYAEEVHGFEPQEPELRHSQRRARSPREDE